MAIEVDNLFEALDIILDQRLKDISYDKTEICIITDDSNAKNGRYWVSPNNGETRYEAYSESNEYKKGESVRVSILNGDFTQKKFITGKYVVDDAITPMTYVSPLNTVIDVTGNMVSNAKFEHQFGLVANGTRKEIPIWSADLNLDESYRDLQASGIYNTIALSAQFRTLLDNYDMRTGSYGLRLDIYTKVNPESDKYIVRSVGLDSSEMFGNPYNFVIYGTQAKKFDLSQIGTVEKMVLWFYQSGDFSYYDVDARKTITLTLSDDYKNRDNILMRNVMVSFGSDLSIVSDNTIQAYTSNAQDYRLIVTEADNEKRLGFLWYNKDGNNQYLGFSDGVVEFETNSENEPILINKLNKKWENATEDVTDENGKVILEFVREDGQIVLVPWRDSSGNIREITSISNAKTALTNEITTLQAKLQQDYEDGIVGDEEFNSRSQDIRDYRTVKTTYLDTPHSDPEAQAAAAKVRDEAYAEAEAKFNSNQINDLTLRDLKRAADRVYEAEIARIQNYRIEMTYVIRGRQQEVFTYKIKDYDEIDYLIASEADNRLMAQNGREDVASDYKSLKIAADFAEAKPLIDKTINLVTKDLYGVLRQMQQRTQSVAEIADLLKTLLTNPQISADGIPTPGDTENINAWYDSVDRARVNMNNVYAQFLAYNYRNQEWLKLLPAEQEETARGYLTTDEQLEAWVNNPINLWDAIKNEFEDKLVPMLNTFFNTVATILQAPGEGETKINYSGYQGIYDTYYNNAKKVAISIQANLDKLELLLNGDAENPSNNTTMKSMPPYIGNTYAYIDYTKKDFSADDNKYAIYWYRYEPGYKSDDRLISAEWRRLETKADFGISDSTDKVYNFGLPIYDDFELRDGKYYFSSKAIDTNTTVTRMMDGMREEEKYKVILFYNHEMFESNEVTFKNLDGVPDATTADRSDAIVIKHEENSQDTYQSYGLNNYLVNAADASKIRTISVHYEGLLAADEALAGTQVYWYLPNQGTMLTCDDKHLTETLGFFSDKDIADAEKPDYSREGYTCYYKPIRSKTITIEDDPNTDDVNEASEEVTAEPEDLTFTYKIKDYYLSTSSRNNIICKIVKDEYTFETELVLAFTSLGTSGTDYTLAITPATTQVATYLDNTKPLTLNIALYDYNNKPLSISQSMNLMGENGATSFKTDWEGPNSYVVQLMEGDLGVNGATVTLSTVPGENDSLIYGIMKVTADCPIKYEVADDGSDVFGDVAEDAETGTKQSTRTVQLTAYYPVPYSAGDYYIEGPTTIVYDSMGSNPSYYKDPFKIFLNNSNQNIAEIKQENSEEVRYDIKWRMVYYKKGSNNSVVKLDKNTHKDYNMCRNYMPTLNEKNGINPTSMYMDNMDCWCAVECWSKDLTVKKKDQKYTLLWVQPILIIQNRYASPMLNSWDGSLTIDKKNGTILSSMVGAGRKTRQNTFEGVLMGDIEASAGIYDAKNKSGLGLYGFNDGAQSFGFNVDGTGFIGKSGRGRIQFNGNEGTIESASYTTGDKPFGMKIDFDDGWIDMKGGVEFEEEDWINYIIEKYAQVLDALERVYDEQTGAIATGGNVIKSSEIPLEIQQKLLEKIQQDAANTDNMYSHAIDVLQAKIETASGEERESFKAEQELMQAKRLEYDANNIQMYYALTTLKTALLEESFEVDGAVYEFKPSYYNLILNNLDEAVLMETYAGEVIGAEENYKARYGELSKALQTSVTDVSYDENGVEITNERSNAQSNIHLDVKAPYFYIVSEQGNRLINVGTNDDFNIKSYRNNPREPEPFQGKGYYLKTNDYMPSGLNLKGEGNVGSGMLIDLAGNKIDAYDFNIKGESSTHYPGSYFSINSDPTKKFIDIYYLPEISDLRDKTGEGVHLFEMGIKEDSEGKIQEEIYRLHSFDWNINNASDPHGMEIDLAAGSMTIHPGWDICNTTDEGGHIVSAASNKSIVIDSNHSTYPFQIGPVVDSTNNLRRFRVGWDGSIITPNFQVDAEGKLDATEGKIGGWNISSSALSSTAVTLSSSTEGNVIRVANGAFNVTAGGTVTASDINISGANSTINSVSISSCTVSSCTISAGTIGSASISSCDISSCDISEGTIDSADITEGTIESADITDCTIESCDITSCTITDELIYGSYACNVKNIDCGYRYYSFGFTPVVTSVTINQNWWGTITSVVAPTKYVMCSYTPYYLSRTYDVFAAEFIEVDEPAEEAEEGESGEDAGGVYTEHHGSTNPWGAQPEAKE